MAIVVFTIWILAMNYLHVIGSMDPRTGGPCQGVRNLSLRARERGHSLEVVCLDDPGADYLIQERLKVHALGKGRGAWCYHPALRPWLEANLPRFDAVILNGLWLYPGYVLSQVTRRPNMPPYFVFPHGMLDPWFQRAPKRRWKAIRNWCYWKLIEQYVVRRAAALLFTCAEEMRLARDTFRPYQPQQQVNVGYGVSQPPEFHESMVDAFAQACPGLNGRPYFIFLGRIDPKKGVDLLIQAYATVYGNGKVPASRSSLGDQGVTPALVIAGPGLETKYGRQMQQLAAELCPPTPASRSLPVVLWPGMLVGDAKWGALYQANAFVLPSHQENFGIAVVEALACEKPVLISNQVNIWLEIEADRAGLAAEDTLAGTQQLFQRWMNFSPEEKKAMTQAAKGSYSKRFGIAQAAQTLLTSLEEFTGHTGKKQDERKTQKKPLATNSETV
jgi:glycosyltransferase involved in cell wall biosynthesis